VGNAIVTLIWKLVADRTRDPRVLVFAQRLVVITDVWFTVGGVVLLALGGYGAALVAGLDLLSVGWLLWGQGLLAISGALWAGVLIPAQIRQGRQARTFVERGEIPASYWQAGLRWALWGVVATLLLLIAIGVMVANPGAYGFELALWLSQALARVDLFTSYPVGEDWGWFIEYIEGEAKVMIGCSSHCKAGDGYCSQPVTEPFALSLTP